MTDFATFFETYRNNAYTKFLNYSFRDLIIANNDIEDDLIRDIKEIIHFYFGFQGYKNNGFRFYDGTTNFSYTFDYIKSSRELQLKFFTDKLKSKAKHYQVKIDNFGSIKTINIQYLDTQEKYVAELSNFLEFFISATYNSLENSFRNKCEHIADSIGKRLNTILKNHFESQEKDHLTSSIRFFLFQKNAGLFYFDNQSYQMSIDKFKLEQDDQYSPFELMVWLITNPLPFTKSLSSESFNNEGAVVSQYWKEANFLDEEKFFEAAQRLYDFEPYSVVGLFESDNEEFSLSVAFYKKDKEDIVPELQIIKKALEREFQNGVKKYSSFIKNFNLSYRTNGISYRNKLIGEISGYFTSTLIKGLSQ